MQELSQRIAELANRIKQAPDDWRTADDVRMLAEAQGDWVLEAITDHLTDEDPGTYSQHLQDMLTTQSDVVPELHGAEPDVDSGLVRLIYYGILPANLELPDDYIARWIYCELTPGDFWKIEREAHLTSLEGRVWGYYVRGYEVERIADFLHDSSIRRRVNYRPEQVARILDRTKLKVLTCPTLGWRTCLAEDMRRGMAPPARISPIVVVKAEA
jgi:hypothetical protein